MQNTTGALYVADASGAARGDGGAPKCCMCDSAPDEDGIACNDGISEIQEIDNSWTGTVTSGTWRLTMQYPAVSRTMPGRCSSDDSYCEVNGPSKLCGELFISLARELSNWFSFAA